MARLSDIASRIDALSVRERGLIMMTTLVALYIIWDLLFLGPLQDRRERLVREIQDVGEERGELIAEMQVLQGRSRTDPDIANRARLKELNAELEQVSEELEKTTEQLVKPSDMAHLLEQMIVQSSPSSFLGLSGTGVRPLLEGAVNATPEQQAETTLTTGGKAAYKHGLSLQLDAGYLETLGILQDIEALPWNFFWERVQLDVSEYPQTRVDVELFTLSWDKDWIGV